MASSRADEYLTNTSSTDTYKALLTVLSVSLRDVRRHSTSRSTWLTSSTVFLPLFLRTCKSAGTTEASLFAFIGAAVAVPMAAATLLAVAKLKVYACPLSAAWAVYILATGSLAIAPEGLVGLDIAAVALQGAASGIILGKRFTRLY